MSEAGKTFRPSPPVRSARKRRGRKGEAGAAPVLGAPVLSPSTLVDLQSTAGNAAVVSLVQRYAADQAPVTVQRKVGFVARWGEIRSFDPEVDVAIKDFDSLITSVGSLRERFLAAGLPPKVEEWVGDTLADAEAFVLLWDNRKVPLKDRPAVIQRINAWKKTLADLPGQVPGKVAEDEERRKQEKLAAEEREKQRLAELKAAEEKRLADEKAAEEKRIAEEKAAEEQRLAELKAAEEKRLADEKAAEEQRLAEEAEQKRLAEVAEQKRLAEEAEKKRLADEKRLAEERRLAEIAEKKRVAEEQRLAQEALKKQQAEERRVAEEKKRIAAAEERERLREERERKKKELEERKQAAALRRLEEVAAKKLAMSKRAEAVEALVIEAESVSNGLSAFAGKSDLITIGLKAKEARAKANEAMNKLKASELEDSAFLVAGRSMTAAEEAATGARSLAASIEQARDDVMAAIAAAQKDSAAVSDAARQLALEAEGRLATAETSTEPDAPAWKATQGAALSIARSVVALALKATTAAGAATTKEAAEEAQKLANDAVKVLATAKGDTPDLLHLVAGTGGRRQDELAALRTAGASDTDVATLLPLVAKGDLVQRAAALADLLRAAKSAPSVGVGGLAQLLPVGNLAKLPKAILLAGAMDLNAGAAAGVIGLLEATADALADGDMFYFQGVSMATLTNLRGSFSPSELKEFCSAIGKLRLDVLLGKNLNGAALKHYSTDFLANFAGVTTGVMKHLTTIKYKTAPVRMVGGHDHDQFVYAMNHLSGKTGTWTVTNSAPPITNVKYTITALGGGVLGQGTKTLIKGLSGAEDTWQPRADDAAWAAIRAKTFLLAAGTWSGVDTQGMRWKGFHDDGAISTAFPKI